jgi:2-keto-4-pentenoate hydratase
MPQEHPRNESQRSDSPRSESPRSEHLRGEKSGVGSAVNAQVAEMGAKSVTAGLRMQKELFETFQDISRDWFARATSEAELAFKLPRQLTNARSVPDAMSAYQEWLSMCGEDGRRLISDGQKIMDTSARCFANASPTATS